MLLFVTWLSFLLLFHPVNARPAPAPVGPVYTANIYAGLDPWMVAVIVSIIVLLFVMGFCILFRHWYGLDEDDSIVVVGDYEYEWSTHTGFDQATIDASFPVFCFSSVAEERLFVTDCTVCLSEYSEGEMLRRIPKCNHVFHADCIDTWLRSRRTCPVCRAELGSPQPQTADSFAEVEVIENQGNHHNSPIGIVERSDIEDMSRNVQVLRGNLPRSNSTGQLLDCGWM